MWEGFSRTGLYVGSLSQEAVTVTNTGLSPGLGGSLSDSMEKVHGSEALRGLSQMVGGPVTVPGLLQAPSSWSGDTSGAQPPRLLEG